VYLLLKRQGTRPFQGATVSRSYQRHWAPVHLDLVVPDIQLLLPAVHRPRLCRDCLQLACGSRRDACGEGGGRGAELEQEPPAVDVLAVCSGTAPRAARFMVSAPLAAAKQLPLAR